MKNDWLDTELNDEMEDEPWLESLREALKQDEGNIYVPIPSEVEKVCRVYWAMKKLTADQDVEVSYGLFQPFVNCGFVSLEGLVMEFQDTMGFADAASCADNFEIFPLVNGRVRLDFGFNHLVTKVGRIDE